MRSYYETMRNPLQRVYKCFVILSFLRRVGASKALRYATEPHKNASRHTTS
jgi:hypothetical protein